MDCGTWDRNFASNAIYILKIKRLVKVLLESSIAILGWAGIFFPTMYVKETCENNIGTGVGMTVRME